MVGGSVVGGAVVVVVAGAVVVVVVLVVLCLDEELLRDGAVDDEATAAVFCALPLLLEPIAAPIRPSAKKTARPKPRFVSTPARRGIAASGCASARPAPAPGASVSHGSCLGRLPLVVARLPPARALRLIAHCVLTR